MKIDLWRGNSVFPQKFGDAHIVAVFRALEIVFYQDEWLLRHTTNAVEPPIRTALFDRGDFDLPFAEGGQTPASLAKKQIGFHFKQWRHVRFRPRSDECGQYSFPAHFEKQFVHRTRGSCPLIWLRYRRNSSLPRQSSRAPVRLGPRGHFSPLPEAILAPERSAVSIFLRLVCDEGPDIGGPIQR